MTKRIYIIFPFESPNNSSALWRFYVYVLRKFLYNWESESESENEDSWESRRSHEAENWWEFKFVTLKYQSKFQWRCKRSIELIFMSKKFSMYLHFVMSFWCGEVKVKPVLFHKIFTKISFNLTWTEIQRTDGQNPGSSGVAILSLFGFGSSTNGWGEKMREIIKIYKNVTFFGKPFF